MNTQLAPGTLDVHGMSGARRRIDCPPEQVKELARLGLSKKQIARKLGMSDRTFRDNLANSMTLKNYWKDGAIDAGTFTDKQEPKTIWADEESVVQLQPGDEEIVLKALKLTKRNGVKYPKFKRIRHLRDITQWDTGALVASLERLIIHLKITKHENLMFTEYEAYEAAK